MAAWPSIGPVLPRIFSGPMPVATIDKSGGNRKTLIDRPQVSEGFSKMYAHRQDDLGAAFAEGIAAHATIREDMEKTGDTTSEQVGAYEGAPLPGNSRNFGRELATLIQRDPSIQVVFLDFGGWDTHVNQGGAKGQLSNKLRALVSGMDELIRGLGPIYANTNIIVMSEFGRTAKENGNGGTDHGHGNVMWLFGGTTPGGKVYGRWSSLAERNLHEARDLPTTTDFRCVLSAVLNRQLEVSSAALARIFPGFADKQNPFAST